MILQMSRVDQGQTFHKSLRIRKILNFLNLVLEVEDNAFKYYRPTAFSGE